VASAVTRTVNVQAVFSDTEKIAFTNIINTAFNDKTHKAGISVAVVKGGYPAWSYATGKATETRDMTAATPAILYSITKTIVSAQILKLVEAGSLNLTDKLGDALNGHVDLSSFDNTKINLNATLEQLLNHTSGIQDYVGNTAGIGQLVTSIVMGATWKPVQLINLVQDAFSTDNSHYYSNTNYILLGMIAEHKGGENLHQLISTQLFSNIGITGSLLPRQNKPSNLSEPYDDLATQGGTSSTFGNLVAQQPFVITGIGISTWATAAMAMTAEDVAKWGYELYSNQGRVLQANTRTILIDSAINSPSANKYGLGITEAEFVLHGETKKVYGHGGGGPGYITILYYNPDTDASIAILINSNNNGAPSNGIQTFTADDLPNISKALLNALPI